MIQSYLFYIFLIFLSLGFNPSKAEQPLKGIELEKKKDNKIKAYRKSV